MQWIESMKEEEMKKEEGMKIYFFPSYIKKMQEQGAQTLWQNSAKWAQQRKKAQFTQS